MSDFFRCCRELCCCCLLAESPALPLSLVLLQTRRSECIYRCFAGTVLPGPLGLLGTCNSKLYITMTFQMIKFSMIHLAPYQTRFYRDMIEILVPAFRSKYSHRIRMIHILTELPSLSSSWSSSSGVQL